MKNAQALKGQHTQAQTNQDDAGRELISWD